MKTLALILIVWGCYMGQLDYDSNPRSIPTLYVENRSTDPYRIYYQGRYVGRVLVGESKCIVLRAISSSFGLLEAKSLSGTVQFPDLVALASWPGWVWELDSMPYTTGINLRPADNCNEAYSSSG